MRMKTTLKVTLSRLSHAVLTRPSTDAGFPRMAINAGILGTKANVALLIAGFSFHGAWITWCCTPTLLSLLSDGFANPIQACIESIFENFFSSCPTLNSRLLTHKKPTTSTLGHVCVCERRGSSESTRQPIQLCTLPGLCGCVLCVFFPTAGPVQAVTQRRPRQQVRADLLSALLCALASALPSALPPARQRDKGTQQLQPRTPTRSSSSTTTTTTATTNGASRG